MIRVLLSVFSIILVTSIAHAKQIRVAVIDTGIFPSRMTEVRLCKDGHKDFTGEGLTDYHGHGTNVSGLIDKYAGDADYCQVIVKYYPSAEKLANKDFSIANTRAAFRYAIDLKVDFINYSSTGRVPDKEERALILEALDKGIVVVVPSGNDDINLNKRCIVYPACYDKRLIVVGRSDTSLFSSVKCGTGKIVDVLENGHKQKALGVVQSGTSQATAITTGKLINKRCRNGISRKK